MPESLVILKSILDIKLSIPDNSDTPNTQKVMPEYFVYDSLIMKFVHFNIKHLCISPHHVFYRNFLREFFFV